MRQQGFLPRLLLSVSVVLLVIGAWGPWDAVTYHTVGFSDTTFVSGGASELGYTLIHFFGARFSFSPLLLTLFFAWDAVFLVGLWPVIALWFFQRAPRRVLIPAAGWLALATVALAISSYGMLAFSHSGRVNTGCGGCPSTTQTFSAPMWGFWLAWVGLLLAWVALTLLIRERVRASAVAAQPVQHEVSAPAATRPSFLRWLAGASYTLGALAWGVALLALPWATSGCTRLVISLSHYGSGGCATTDAYDGLDRVFPYASLTPYTPLVEFAPLRLFDLLFAFGAIAVVLMWSKRRTGIRGAWAAVWLAGIILLTLACVAGSYRIIANPPQIIFGQSPNWILGPGVYLAIIGVVLCACGVALRVVRWRGARTRQTWASLARETGV